MSAILEITQVSKKEAFEIAELWAMYAIHSSHYWEPDKRVELSGTALS